MSEPIIREVRNVLNRAELRRKLPGIEMASIARAGAIRPLPLVPSASSHGRKLYFRWRSLKEGRI